MTFNLKKMLCTYQRFFMHLVMIRNDKGKKSEKQYIPYTAKFQSLHSLFFVFLFFFYLFLVMTRILQDQSSALVKLLIIVYIFGSCSSKVRELFPLFPYEKWDLNLCICKIVLCRVPVLLSLQCSSSDLGHWCWVRHSTVVSRLWTGSKNKTVNFLTAY